jgi:DNA/RNA endonuclease YhcR with UshA esterase domain
LFSRITCVGSDNLTYGCCVKRRKKLTVRGVVDEVHTSSRGNIFLNMGGHYPNQAFTGFIRASDASEFANVHAVQGKPASISGTIKLYKGKPEIELQSATQLIAK